MATEVMAKASKVKGRRNFRKYLKISVLVLLLFLIIVYLVLRVTYNDTSFVVNLRDGESLESGLAMFESLNNNTGMRVLKAENVQFMDNISIKWLPDDIDTEGDGSHNGDNYIAYTFYIENQGKDIFSYWYKMVVDDVIRNVDEAVRVMIIVNGEKTVYAKGSSLDGHPEVDTVKFRNDEDGTIILQQRKNMNPDEIDRITVVVWIEGDDPECIDALIGGQIKMHMDITEEHTNNN